MVPKLIKQERRAGKTMFKCVKCGTVFTMYNKVQYVYPEGYFLKLNDGKKKKIYCPIRNCGGVDIYKIEGLRKEDN